MFYRQQKLTQNEKFKLRRALLGIEQKSNFGEYNYKVKGLLDDIPHYRPVDSAIIVKLIDKPQIISILKKYNVFYEVFDIEIPLNKLKMK